MIISQTLLHLGIARKYEKYIRLVISFMVAAQVIFSFAAFSRVHKKPEVLEEGFMEAWEGEMQEFEKEMEEIQKKIYKKLELEGSKSSNAIGEPKETQKILVETIRIE